MATHWILRVRDGNHFWSSSSDKLWGITSTFGNAKGFLRDVKEGDILWFLTNKSVGGKLVAVATFTEKKPRILGPLLALTKTNEELGWTQVTGEWDTEIHYKDLYDLTPCSLIPDIHGQAPIRRYNAEKCVISLPQEYPYIVKYSQANKQ